MYVTEAIGDNYKNWNKGDIIVIHAQTGAGKTYFVLNKLLAYVSSQEKHLLYLSNRSALKSQVELSYPKEFQNSIITLNYQKFELVDLSRHEHSETGESILNCEYWVMDESHYFLADGSFNSNVSDCLGNIKYEQKRRILIFMTATPKYLFLALGSYGFFSQRPNSGLRAAVNNYSTLLYQMSSPNNLLQYKEVSDNIYSDHKKFLKQSASHNSFEYMENFYFINNYINPISNNRFQNKFQELSDYINMVSKEVILYHASNGYEYVRPVYFKFPEQLCERIGNTSEQEKWLIFVSSKKRGEQIKDYLETKSIDSVIITSETKHRKRGLGRLLTKEYEVYKSIIDDSKSPIRVTIATSVLDNGVNLKDPALKHIAILEMNPTIFLQMLGRKRLESPEERINLYLQAKDLGEIKAYFERSILQYARFLVKLQTVNSLADSADWLNNVQVITALQAFQSEYQTNGNFKSPFNYYVSLKAMISDKEKKDFLGGPYLCRYFQPNPVTSIQLMYDYYRMLALLELYENTPEKQKKARKEILWIEHQLSWMELDYNPTHWIDYAQHLAAENKLKFILSKYEGESLPKQVQKQFRETIITIVNTSHPPMDVKIGKASLSKVNEALAELQFSQRIESQNCSIKGKQRNYWFVTRNSEQNKK